MRVGIAFPDTFRIPGFWIAIISRYPYWRSQSVIGVGLFLSDTIVPLKQGACGNVVYLNLHCREIHLQILALIEIACGAFLLEFMK